jgi:hypothetical protein
MSSGSSGEMTAECLALLAEKVGAAAAYLREHPQMPGWVVWQTASFYPGFRPAEASGAGARAQSELGPEASFDSLVRESLKKAAR